MKLLPSWVFHWVVAALQIKLLGLTPHWVCSPQAAPISSLFPVMLSVKQEARMWIFKNIFGREFGGYGFLTRLNILFGKVVMTLCQLWATSIASRLRPLISVNFANSAQKIRCMPSGLARMLRVLGAQSNASTNRAAPQPLNFCDLLSRFLQIQEDYRKEVFAISAWFLWNRRNAIHFGRPVHPSAHIISLAGNLLQDFLATQELDPVVACSPILQRWRPPELN